VNPIFPWDHELSIGTYRDNIVSCVRLVCRAHGLSVMHRLIVRIDWTIGRGHPAVAYAMDFSYVGEKISEEIVISTAS
jgi:hypothetical protein